MYLRLTVSTVISFYDIINSQGFYTQLKTYSYSSLRCLFLQALYGEE
ncbi:hypothetical protein BE20_0026 [Staphylococcus phage vB_SepS_BE20]|nr:hypothetical protein BE20_0026 [Staphylococcus phage vB_SepS_BE20]